MLLFFVDSCRQQTRKMAVANKATGFWARFPALKRWAYNLSGFNQYGLHHDDCLDELNPDVKEALRRVPDHLIDERQFRMQRAFQLSLSKQILPKDQWTKYEEDHRYLKPYLEEVIREREERENWNKNH